MVFYAWLGLLVEFVFVLGVVVFVLAGGAYQRSAIMLLSQRVQRMQLANQALQSEFLNTQRALRGYQATGQARFAQSFYAGQAQFVDQLVVLRRLVWPGVLGGVTAEEEAARAAFVRGGEAILAPSDSRATARLFDQASASSDAFVRQNDRLQSRLHAYSTVFIDRAQRTLGIGMVGTSAILGVGLMLPMLAIGLALRWTSAPLHGLTKTVRKQALGEHQARAVVHGPGDVQELARSVNFLADESDRLRSVREAATRIYEHLHAPAIISEAVAALEDNLAVDVAWVGLVTGEELSSLGADPAPERTQDFFPAQPAYSLEWIRELFDQRSSYYCQDLDSGIPANLPPHVQDLVRDPNAASLLLTPFGTGRELMGVLTLVRNKGGRPWIEPEIEAVQSLARDIGRALAHARLYEAEERNVAELQSLDRAKARFLASSSHDLRTPLTSIIGNVEIMQDGDPGPLTAKQTAMLDAVSRNGRRLLNLIEDMLTISKIELGAFTSDLRPVDLGRLMPEPVDLITPSMRDAGITFYVLPPDEDLMVNGDAGQLGRVLMNLLTNAMKYTSRGGLVMCTATAENDEAVLMVQDTGMGIPEDEQETLGTPFFRASNAIRREIQGSGLGLSIVRTVVGNHKGRVELDSKEGVGTKVTVRIPLLRSTTLSGASPNRAGSPLNPPPGAAQTETAVS
jgi:signal transduction histidine kinase/CHASE3 domain sensor protein